MRWLAAFVCMFVLFSCSATDDSDGRTGGRDQPTGVHGISTSPQPVPGARPISVSTAASLSTQPGTARFAGYLRQVIVVCR